MKTRGVKYIVGLGMGAVKRAFRLGWVEFHLVEAAPPPRTCRDYVKYLSRDLSILPAMFQDPKRSSNEVTKQRSHECTNKNSRYARLNWPSAIIVLVA